ncbi:hypothetical protein SAMN05216548_11312 [Faunimonas pinastri]|uniref:Uncharacterized protein n=1 Tax=Faunimonas pinastri TaxID=1855383 RepID=A0A1H9M929_9HYPH|nr:hypothetical protein SAMN05216548_11312 [Faunimonas pinastri]
MMRFFRSLRRKPVDHSSVFAEFSLRLAWIVMSRQPPAEIRPPRFRIVR